MSQYYKTSIQSLLLLLAVQDHIRKLVSFVDDIFVVDVVIVDYAVVAVVVVAVVVVVVFILYCG